MNKLNNKNKISTIHCVSSLSPFSSSSTNFFLFEATNSKKEILNFDFSLIFTPHMYKRRLN